LARTHFDHIGITGYPESYHRISDDATIRAMFAKADMATDIISQVCFDAGTIAGRLGEDAKKRGSDVGPTPDPGRPE
jgi:methylenetetrahydrofolate reductase (NADPH)